MIKLVASILFSLATFVVSIQAQFYVAKKQASFYEEKNKRFYQNQSFHQETLSREKQQEQKEEENQLYDVIHEIIYYPIFSKLDQKLQNLIVKFLDIFIHVTFFLVVFLGIFFLQGEIRFEEFFSRYLNRLSLVFLIRNISFNLTILPRCDYTTFLKKSEQKTFDDSDEGKEKGKVKGKEEKGKVKGKEEKGKVKGKEETNAVKIVFDFLTMKETKFGYKNDLLFSGHTAFLVTSFLMIHQFACAPTFFLATMWTSGLIVTLGLACTKKHYTVDILFAWITSFLAGQAL
jgi:hypothetical protein